jgi:hypothetical protein
MEIGRSWRKIHPYVPPLYQSTILSVGSVASEEIAGVSGSFTGTGPDIRNMCRQLRLTHNLDGPHVHSIVSLGVRSLQ